MAHVEVVSGICGFTTAIEAWPDKSDPFLIHLAIKSDCPEIEQLAGQLTHVNALQECTFRGTGPRTLQNAAECLQHPACPVPTGIIKAVEVAAGLALPKDASIKVSAG